MNGPTSEPDLSPAEAARILNVSEKTIRRWLRIGIFPSPAYKLGSLWRIQREGFDRFREDGGER